MRRLGFFGQGDYALGIDGSRQGEPDEIHLEGDGMVSVVIVSGDVGLRIYAKYQPIEDHNWWVIGVGPAGSHLWPVGMASWPMAWAMTSKYSPYLELSVPDDAQVFLERGQITQAA